VPPPLKDFVDAALVERLAARVAAVHPGFDGPRFAASVVPCLGSLELKERIALIADALAAGLPRSFPEAAAVVVAAAEHPDPPIDAWQAWPLNTFVERHGVGHPEVSLDAMERLTRHASSEFAVRPLLARSPEIVFSRLEVWAGHPDAAVRRLVSEGTRPLLPWGMRVAVLREHPERGLALAGRLRDDPSEAVRRSVANHLNDVSRDHPDLAVATAREWAQGATDETRDLLRHGLRTLVKQGHPGALEVLGFDHAARIAVDLFAIDPPEAHIGERVEVSALLHSEEDAPCRVVVDLVVHYVRAGGRTSPKVFKWRVLDLAPREAAGLRRRLSMIDMSTRTHHPGRHRVTLQVAGVAAAEASFELLAVR
jgi:3-methyladenine DNA glycosylase AlkC